MNLQNKNRFCTSNNLRESAYFQKSAECTTNKNQGLAPLTILLFSTIVSFPFFIFPIFPDSQLLRLSGPGGSAHTRSIGNLRNADDDNWNWHNTNNVWLWFVKKTLNLSTNWNKNFKKSIKCLPHKAFKIQLFLFFWLE